MVLNCRLWPWPCMAVCGRMWPFMALCGHMWPCMAIYGLVWPYVVFCGRVCVALSSCMAFSWVCMASLWSLIAKYRFYLTCIVWKFGGWLANTYLG